MYQSILDSINATIEHHKKLNPSNHKLSEQEVHYFIQGLEVAKQLVEQTQELNVEELAYETFEDTVRTLSDHLDRYDMEVIIEDVFMDKDSEEYEAEDEE
ncbi:hypothetical protein [Bacillus sp. T33-2]|uniref:hypothetical protein n=1 Tax=Bacillus sp. T33-2 TaxID=2054168 RepID=UPI000C76A499|nr:hypothetical protein [Bacillus sp. T33-2]PLR99505.1 hypothetical protein CVD19_00145 [Bacillus sp. T33-2]